MCVNAALLVSYVLLLTAVYAMLLTTVRCWGCLLVQKMNPIPCTGCHGNNKLFRIFFSFFFRIYVSFVDTCNKYCCCTKACVCVFLKHESASAVCVFGNSQRVEMSRRSGWSFHTVQAQSRDFAALARSLVLSDTSHRLALPLWVEQNPCGSWDIGRGIHSCHKPAGLCCPAGHSPRGNRQAIEGLGWEALSGSVPLWRRC